MLEQFVFIYIMSYINVNISWGMTLNNVYPTFINLKKIKF
jgi:hypothetical protein